MSDSNVSNIGTALVKIMEEIGNVKSTGDMKGQYSYLSEGDVLKAVKTAMIKEGVFIYPAEISDSVYDTYESKTGTRMVHFHAQYGYKVAHPASDTFIMVYARGEGADVGDKSANKAATGALKYALRQLFMLGGGDDPDATDSESQAGGSGGSRQRQSRQKPADKKQPGTPQEVADVRVPAFNESKMKDALQYKVPQGFPLATYSFEKVLLQPSLAPVVIAYLAGVEPGGEGNMFEPKTPEEKQTSAAARYIFAHNEEFKKMWEEYKSSVKN